MHRTTNRRQSTPRWGPAQHHGPRQEIQPIDCRITLATGPMLTATLLMGMDEAMKFTGPAYPGIHSPAMTLRETGRVIAHMTSEVGHD